MDKGAGVHGKPIIAGHRSLTAANFLSKLPPGFAGYLATPGDTKPGDAGHPGQETSE